jgi:hypothetical protein
MPALETTDRISDEGALPRSLPPLRPILQKTPTKGKQKQQEKQTVEPSAIVPVAQRASKLRPRQTEGGEENQDVQEWKLGGAGDEEKAQHPKPKKTGSTSTLDDPGVVATSDDDEVIVPARKRLSRLPRPKVRSAGTVKTWYTHPFFYLAIGMVLMLALWALLTSVANWWSVKWDDIQYGRPRTFQVDAVVGHNDSASNPSHFIAINLNGRIEIIEFPGGDGSKARIYIGPQLYGDGEDLVPVTLSFVDVSGNHHPDMIVHFQNTQIVFVNENGGFRPATPQELQTIQRYLQQNGG